MSTKINTNSQTPMLTLNQKLPGEQPLFKAIKQHRPYRQGVLPQWLKSKADQPLPTAPPQHPNPTPKIIREAPKLAETPQPHPIANSETEDTDSDDNLIDLANLDLGALRAEELPQPPPQPSAPRSHRAALKNSLLKSLQLKEDFLRLSSKEPAAAEEQNSRHEPSNPSSPKPPGLSEDSAEEAPMRRFHEEKPQFVRSSRRDPAASGESANALALALRTQSAAEEKAAAERRRAESVSLLVEVARREKDLEEKAAEEKLAALPDDRDDLDEEGEFECWKLRELTRMKEDAEQRARLDEEAAVVRLRRVMGDEEREADNRLHGSKRYEKEQRSIDFLQKYHHKGVFYQDDELIHRKLMERDFMQPVGADRYTDRTLLPEVMQVKNFGLASRSKYTHLVDEDTTFGVKKTPAILGKPDLGAQAEGRKEAPVMGDHRNPVNPWIDFRSAKSRRFRRGGEGGFERPSKRAKR